MAGEQHRKGWINWQRVVLLRCGEREEAEDEEDPDDCKQPSSACSRRRLWLADKATPQSDGQGQAPGKEPCEVQQPEPNARHGVVVARIAHVEEAEEMLVQEVEPEKAVVFARAECIVQSKYGGLRSVARMCHGAAMTSTIRAPLKGRSRLNNSRMDVCRVMPR